MHPDTHTQRVLDLASQKGLIRASDLDAIHAPRIALTRLTGAGLLERVGRGLYRLPGIVPKGGGEAWAPWPPRLRKPCSACSRRYNFTS